MTRLQQWCTCMLEQVDFGVAVRPTCTNALQWLTHKQGLTLRTTCCQMLRSFKKDRGFSSTSAAPSSIPLHTSSVLLLFSDMRTSGRCEADSRKLPPSVASLARALACTIPRREYFSATRIDPRKSRDSDQNGFSHCRSTA